MAVQGGLWSCSHAVNKPDEKGICSGHVRGPAQFREHCSMRHRGGDSEDLTGYCVLKSGKLKAKFSRLSDVGLRDGAA